MSDAAKLDARISLMLDRCKPIHVNTTNVSEAPVSDVDHGIAPGARPRILLVEDDARAARGLSRMLVDDGYEVERVSDGAAAIARLSTSPLPDALVTDFYMPHADGLTVAQFARSRNPRIPTVVVTGHAEFVAQRPTSLRPAPIVLVKPLDYDVLARTLRALLRVAA